MVSCVDLFVIACDRVGSGCCACARQLKQGGKYRHNVPRGTFRIAGAPAISPSGILGYGSRRLVPPGVFCSWAKFIWENDQVRETIPGRNVSSLALGHRMFLVEHFNSYLRSLTSYLLPMNEGVRFFWEHSVRHPRSAKPPRNRGTDVPRGTFCCCEPNPVIHE